MNPKFPIIELVDRLAIAEVKFERTKANGEELHWYTNEASRIDLNEITNDYKNLKAIHEKIWDLESELKTGRETEISLEELGRRAIVLQLHDT